jgi:hypothetical protein
MSTESLHKKRNAVEEFIEGLSAILAERKLISPEDMIALYHGYKNRADSTFEEFLLEEGVIDREDLLESLSEYYKVPYFDTTGASFDHQFLRLIPKDIMLDHLFIPWKRDEGEDALWVVAANPNDPHLLVVLGKYVSHDINFMVGLPQDIRDAIREFYDESITYQPNSIASAPMERSQQEVHPSDQIDQNIPEIVEETVDDYERE